MDDLLISEDGSHTIMSDRFGVSYHSKFGAVQETQTVFIDAGLDYVISRGARSIHILEMGFGTGLNAIMTMQSVLGTPIDYHTIEAYPITRSQYTELNYPTVLELTEDQKNAFIRMHEAPDGEKTTLSEHFDFTKYICMLQDFDTDVRFDLIYYDAFAPTSQEELWTPEVMTKLYDLCNDDAVLVTYCAKGSFKRALKSAGFEVEALDGPVGKREMTRAKKC